MVILCTRHGWKPRIQLKVKAVLGTGNELETLKIGYFSWKANLAGVLPHSTKFMPISTFLGKTINSCKQVPRISKNF